MAFAESLKRSSNLAQDLFALEAHDKIEELLVEHLSICVHHIIPGLSSHVHLAVFALATRQDQ